MSQEETIVQHWEGFVFEILSGTFWARLIPVIGEGPDLEAEIITEKLEGDEQKFLEVGAVFDWIISENLVTKEGISRITFRKDVFTEEELEAARLEGYRLHREFNDWIQEDGECQRLT